MNGMPRRVINYADMMLRKSDASIVNTFKNHNKTVKSATFNLLPIFVGFVICSTMTKLRKKYTIVINVEYAELEDVINLSIATHAKLV